MAGGFSLTSLRCFGDGACEFGQAGRLKFGHHGCIDLAALGEARFDARKLPNVDRLATALLATSLRIGAARLHGGCVDIADGGKEIREVQSRAGDRAPGLQIAGSGQLAAVFESGDLRSVPPCFTG